MRPAAWLGLAATPTFAVMAAVAHLQAAAGGLAICGPAPSPLSGMAVMYLLMAGFHLPPWLRLAARR